MGRGGLGIELKMKLRVRMSVVRGRLGLGIENVISVKGRRSVMADDLCRFSVRVRIRTRGTKLTRDGNKHLRGGRHDVDLGRHDLRGRSVRILGFGHIFMYNVK